LNGKEDRIQNTEFRIQKGLRGARSRLPVCLAEF
jgi:hypothetical protein